MFRLSNEERKKVAETVVKTALGRVTVFIHVGAMKQEDTLELAEHAVSIGVVSPAFFNVNDLEMEEYFVTVANSVPNDFSVYLYNIPQCSSRIGNP